MKTNTLLVSSLLTLAMARYAAAQGGSLTPPAGPPGPVMKTLDQIEARTPLVEGAPGVSIDAGTGTITIGQRGSYYLTGNITNNTVAAHGVVIAQNDVTLDLNGFALVCTSVDGGDAITISNVSNVRIHNGSIIGGTTWNGSAFTRVGWNNGVSTLSGTETNLSVSDIMVKGTRAKGIDLLFQGTQVERCSVHTAGSLGISANSIRFSIALKTGSAAIASSDNPFGSVTDCVGESVSTSGASGITAIGTVANSRGTSSTGKGIEGGNVINSYGTSTSSTGLTAITASNSTGTSTSGTGLNATVASNCYGQTSSGSRGLLVTGTASFCRAGHFSGGVAIEAAIAAGCTAVAGSITAPQKHLGTP